MPLDPNRVSSASERLRARIWLRHARRKLPIRPLSDAEAVVRDNESPPLRERPISRGAQVIDLRSDDGWAELYSSFALGALLFTAPWNRCLSLLHGLGALTCVVEEHYVCLDYKSEMLSFYAQLDAAREVATSRLHFFATPLTDEEVFDLGEKANTYLGYIVCRHGNLPLVGRCNIAVPSYIDVAAATVETVHFFGQRVSVTGVPFMQQDSQFAVCSQVTAWSAHYTAFRRGLVQRRLVAELVAMSGSGALEPMRPHVSEGLSGAAVATLFHRTGLNTSTYYTPRGGPVEYPPIAMESIAPAAAIVNRIRARIEAEVQEPDEPGNRSGPRITGFGDFRAPTDDLAEFATDISRYAQLRHVDDPLRKDATALLDMVLAYLLRPYIRSRFPIFCGTRNHAYLLCGISDETRHKTTYYIHDDTYGPYVALDSLIDASRTALANQAYDGLPYPEIFKWPAAYRTRPDEDSDSPGFPEDRTSAVSSGSPFSAEDVERQAEVFIVATPPRLILTPAEAENDAFQAFAAELTGQRKTAEVDDEPWRVRSTVLMGIDYKRIRGDNLRSDNDGRGAAWFASIHLAEWVIVIEGMTEDLSSSEWEVVYDGSSGATGVTVQLARFGRSIIFDPPQLSGFCEVGELISDTLPALVAPLRIGKAD